MTTIETQIWEADDTRPGYLKLTRTRTVGEVFDELRGRLGEYPEGGEDYLSCLAEDRESEWPQGRIVVFPVSGDSEGHYTHIEVHSREDGSRKLIFLAKTFSGWDAAWYFAKRVAEMFDE